MPRTRKNGEKEMSVDMRIKKVKVLQGRAREQAEKMKLAPDDLVVLTTSVNSLPEYKIEKIDGDPVSYLIKHLKS